MWQWETCWWTWWNVWVRASKVWVTNWMYTDWVMADWFYCSKVWVAEFVAWWIINIGSLLFVCHIFYMYGWKVFNRWMYSIHIHKKIPAKIWEKGAVYLYFRSCCNYIDWTNRKQACVWLYILNTYIWRQLMGPMYKRKNLGFEGYRILAEWPSIVSLKVCTSKISHLLD